MIQAPKLDAAWHKHKIADRVTNAQAMMLRPSVFAGRPQVLTSELAREESVNRVQTQLKSAPYWDAPDRRPW